MTAGFSAEFTVTEAHLVDALRLLGRRKRSRTLVPLLWLGVASCIALLGLLSGNWQAFSAFTIRSVLAGAAGILLLLLLALYAAVPSLRRRAARNTLATNPNFEVPVRVEFDDEAFGSSARYSSGRYPWKKLWGWREGPNMIVVHPTPQMFYIVPTDALYGDALAALRDGLSRSRKGRLDA